MTCAIYFDFRDAIKFTTSSSSSSFEAEKSWLISIKIFHSLTGKHLFSISELPLWEEIRLKLCQHFEKKRVEESRIVSQTFSTVSLHGCWSPVLLAWVQLLHWIKNNTFETGCTVSFTQWQVFSAQRHDLTRVIVTY